MRNKRILILVFILIFLLLVGCVPLPGKLIGIKVSPDTIILSLGTTLQLEVDAVYDDGNHADITFKCIYSSSNSFIVIVDSYEGLVTAEAPGKATIIVTYISDDGTVFADTAEVTVKADVVAKIIGIKVSPDKITMSVGDTKQLEVTALYDDGSFGDITPDCIYESSNSFIVIVNTSEGSEGKIIAKAPGKAFIVVVDSYEIFSDTAEITVREDVVEEVVI